MYQLNVLLVAHPHNVQNATLHRGEAMAEETYSVEQIGLAHLETALLL